MPIHATFVGGVRALTVSQTRVLRRLLRDLFAEGGGVPLYLHHTGAAPTGAEVHRMAMTMSNSMIRERGWLYPDPPITVEVHPIDSAETDACHGASYYWRAAPRMVAIRTMLGQTSRLIATPSVRSARDAAWVAINEAHRMRRRVYVIGARGAIHGR